MQLCASELLLSISSTQKQEFAHHKGMFSKDKQFRLKCFQSCVTLLTKCMCIDCLDPFFFLLLQTVCARIVRKCFSPAVLTAVANRSDVGKYVKISIFELRLKFCARKKKFYRHVALRCAGLVVAVGKIHAFRHVSICGFGEHGSANCCPRKPQRLNGD